MVWLQVRYIRDYAFAINNSWLYLDRNPLNTCIARIINYATHVRREIPLDLFANSGNLTSLKYFYTTHTNINYTSDLLDNAATNGYFECVKWIFDTLIHVQSDGWYSYQAIAHAAKNGHFEIVQWLYQSFKTAERLGQLHINNMYAVNYINYSSLHGAAQGGHLEILKWLNENTEYHYSEHEMCYAAEHGQLHIIKYLQAQGFQYDEPVFTYAASGGHLNVIEYLYSVNPMGFTATHLNNAINNNHLPAVKWLCEHGTLPEDVWTLHYATSTGNLELCEYVYTCTLQPLNSNMFEDIFKNAIHSNKIYLAKWIHGVQNTCITLEPHLLRTLGQHADLDDIKWVLTVLSYAGVTEYHNILRGAVRGKKYDTAEYMLQLIKN